MISDINIIIIAYCTISLIINIAVLIRIANPHLFNPVGEIQLLTGYANLAHFVNSNVKKTHISHAKGLKVQWVSEIQGVYPFRHVMVKILNSDQPNREYRWSLRELYKVLMQTGGNYRPLK